MRGRSAERDCAAWRPPEHASGQPGWSPGGSPGWKGACSRGASRRAPRAPCRRLRASSPRGTGHAFCTCAVWYSPCSTRWLRGGDEVVGAAHASASPAHPGSPQSQGRELISIRECWAWEGRGAGRALGAGTPGAGRVGVGGGWGKGLSCAGCARSRNPTRYLVVTTGECARSARSVCRSRSCGFATAQARLA